MTRPEGPRLGFQKVHDPTPGKNRVHLDFSAADVEAEVTRLIGGSAPPRPARHSFGDSSAGWCSPTPRATRSAWRGGECAAAPPATAAGGQPRLSRVTSGAHPRDRHRRARRRHSRPAATVPRARPQGRRVPADPRDPRPPAHRRRAGDVLGDVERALLLQVVQGAPALLRRDHHRRDARRRCWPASARTPASSTSATAGRSPSRSSRTTTRPTSSRTRARPPASAASSATSWRWAPVRSR